MAHTYTNLLTHVIFSTRGREKWLHDEIRPPVFAYMGGIIRELHGSARTINGVADHVHLLLSLPPVVSISETVRIVKSNSSRWLHETKPSMRHFAWQEGYAAFSVSQSNAAAVTRYIASQDDHHRRVSFQEELIAFLKKHEIDYDERYLWD